MHSLASTRSKLEFDLDVPLSWQPVANDEVSGKWKRQNFQLPSLLPLNQFGLNCKCVTMYTQEGDE